MKVFRYIHNIKFVVSAGRYIYILLFIFLPILLYNIIQCTIYILSPPEVLNVQIMKVSYTNDLSIYDVHMYTGFIYIFFFDKIIFSPLNLYNVISVFEYTVIMRCRHKRNGNLLN